MEGSRSVLEELSVVLINFSNKVEFDCAAFGRCVLSPPSSLAVAPSWRHTLFLQFGTCNIKENPTV